MINQNYCIYNLKLFKNYTLFQTVNTLEMHMTLQLGLQVVQIGFIFLTNQKSISF